MTLETFKRCLEWEEYPALGGGEPTTHPQFEKFLLLAIGECEQVWLTTNGKKKETALMLAKLAKSGVISCELSQDPWHEEIDAAVVSAFYKQHEHSGINTSNDYRGIRDVSHSPNGPINSGRCDFGVNGCCCEDLFVKPSGDIHHCGCADSPKLSNINEDFDWPEDYEEGCYKNIREEK